MTIYGRTWVLSMAICMSRRLCGPERSSSPHPENRRRELCFRERWRQKKLAAEALRNEAWFKDMCAQHPTAAVSVTRALMVVFVGGGMCTSDRRWCLGV